ncbi:Cdc6/Cdc18 family protein [Halomarina rubra]|uniref:ORC1-type DNA replication protein n=1 Tax=Halomarina rubra TaxID=2071873 RepID=A0ABD6AUC3_9EURY|nr:AAA family ATPase [Halomarina rubra]
MAEDSEQQDSAQLSISEQLSSDYHTVFRDKDLIEPDTIVDEDRIVGRDEQLTKVINVIKPALHGDQPEDMLLRGPSGTGKTLIAGTVATKAIKIAQERDIRMDFVEINGKHKKSEHEAIHQIVHEYELSLGLNLTSKAGVSTSSRYDRLFEIVNEHLDIGVIVLDELDLLVGDSRNNDEAPAFSDILYKLSRAKRIGKMDSTITLIVTTNSPNTLMSGLNSRTASTFNPTEVGFADYNAPELQEILNHRQDAFHEGTLEEEVIPYTAAIAAQGEGDARFAIDLLREAGNIANRREDQSVSTAHAEAAKNQVEKNYIIDVIENVSFQKQVSLFATAIVNSYGQEQLGRSEWLNERSAPAPVAHSLYKWFTEYNGIEQRSKHSFLRWMRELSTYEVIEINRKGRGNERGVFAEYVFHNLSADVMVETLADKDERFQATLDDDDNLVRETVRTHLSRF